MNNNEYSVLNRNLVNILTCDRAVYVPLKAVGANVVFGYKFLLAEVESPAHVSAASDFGDATYNRRVHF